MKIRKQYTLYINGFTMVAMYGNARFGRRIDSVTLGQIWDCNLSELKHNLKMLSKQGFYLTKRRW